MHPHPHTGRRRGWPLLVTLLLLIWSSPVAASAVYQVEPTATPAATPPAQEGAPGFAYRDFRTDWQEGIDRSKAMELYRQPYCGCVYSEAERYAKKLRRLIAAEKK